MGPEGLAENYLGCEPGVIVSYSTEPNKADRKADKCRELQGVVWRSSKNSCQYWGKDEKLAPFSEQNCKRRGRVYQKEFAYSNEHLTWWLYEDLGPPTGYSCLQQP